jgi:hypothetical protein
MAAQCRLPWHHTSVTEQGPRQGFQNLTIHNWRQFADVAIAFHPRLTVLTGANASGKTTLLNLLGRHFNWITQYLGSPGQQSKQGVSWRIDQWSVANENEREIGRLTYRNGQSAQVMVPGASVTYELRFAGEQFVPGLYLSSHRALSAYQQLPSLPARFLTSQQLFASYFSEINSRYRGSQTGRSPMLQMKESLLAAAIFGYAEQVVSHNFEARAVWEGFQEILRILLPNSLGFQRLRIEPPELIMQTESGSFLIDSVSGGISSLIEISWQIFLRSREFESFTVCMDEPENHLHPEMQRSMLPALLRAFPHVSFIVATHSPFIVTAVNDSNVYVLDYEDRSVVSGLLESANKSASSDEVLRRVLGMETTSPLWVEDRISQILSEMPKGHLSAEDLRVLRDRLSSIGLEREFPAALDALTAGEDDAPAR